MNFKTLDEIVVKGKKVLLRVDLNSPVRNGKVMDSPRFDAAAETILDLLRKKAGVAILAHQGRKGDRDYTSLEQHAKILSRKIGRPVSYIHDLFGRKAIRAIEHLVGGEAILLRNVRDYKDETELGMGCYQELCRYFDLYVNDAFSVCHRNQGSIILPPRYLPHVIGKNLERELEALEHFSRKGRMVFVLGGIKAEDYLPLFKILDHKENVLTAAGALGNLFLIIEGKSIDFEKSWLESEGLLKLLPRLRRIYQKYRGQIILPVDGAVEDDRGRREEYPFDQEHAHYFAYDKVWDIGRETIGLFRHHLKNADVIFMKGPLGYTESRKFSYGTVEILKCIARLTRKRRVFSLIGGGHLTTALEKYSIPYHFSYVSLSGGALLRYLTGEKLPGLEALRK